MGQQSTEGICDVGRGQEAPLELSRLRHVAQELDALDIRSFEEAEATELADGLLVRAEALVVAALDVIRDLSLAHADPTSLPTVGPSPPQWGFELELDRMAVDGGGNRLADTAFFALVELEERRRRLARARSATGSDGLLDTCDSAIRRTRKALAAVERVTCLAFGFEPQLVFATELEVSLLTRKTYTKLHAGIVGGKTPDATDLYARMRGVGTRIAMLIGQEIYPELRVGDRVQIRTFQRRILKWLRDERDDTSAGLRLWHDLVTFTEMLGAVSNRQELVEHDLSIVAWLSARTRQGGDLDATELARAESLRGLDPTVDVLLDDATRAVDAWAPVLHTLRCQLGLESSRNSALETSERDEELL